MFISSSYCSLIRTDAFYNSEWDVMNHACVLDLAQLAQTHWLRLEFLRRPRRLGAKARQGVGASQSPWNFE
jgi:hypothetical protein